METDGSLLLSSRPAERHIFMAHKVQRAQPVLSSRKDHAAFHASVVLMCDCDTLCVSGCERESVLFFFSFLIHVYVCLFFRPSWAGLTHMGWGRGTLLQSI